jgi:hypothetical protein
MVGSALDHFPYFPAVRSNRSVVPLWTLNPNRALIFHSQFILGGPGEGNDQSQEQRGASFQRGR